MAEELRYKSIVIINGSRIASTLLPLRRMEPGSCERSDMSRCAQEVHNSVRVTNHGRVHTTSSVCLRIRGNNDTQKQ